MLSVGYLIPKKKVLLSTGTPKQKVDTLDAARVLEKKGYAICATGGSSKFLTENGVENTRVYWPSEEGDVYKRQPIQRYLFIPFLLSARCISFVR